MCGLCWPKLQHRSCNDGRRAGHRGFGDKYVKTVGKLGISTVHESI